MSEPGLSPAIVRFSRALSNQKFPFASRRPPPNDYSASPEQIELHRDRMWRRDEELRVESAVDAERFIEDVGFLNKRSEIRSQRSVFGASVFGRLSPRSIQKKRQKDEETGLAWHLKDEVMRRFRCFRLRRWRTHRPLPLDYRPGYSGSY